MPTLWFNPTEFVTGDPTLGISHPSGAHLGSVVSATTVGDGKWISLGATLPGPVLLESVTICYQVQSAAPPPSSRIEESRLRVTTSPGGSVVLYDDSTPLASQTPVCAVLPVGRPVPDGALELELRLHFTHVTDTIVFTAVGLAVRDLCANHRGLGEFGDYRADIPHAESVLATALSQMSAQGGGVLCIPGDAPAGFVPRNRQPAGIGQPAVTVLDFRDGFERRFVPPIGTLSSAATSRGSTVIERDLATDLAWQDVFSTEVIQSRVYGGASSYLQYLSRAVPSGAAVKNFYVPTLRGLFKGQQLSVTDVTKGYGGGETVTVIGLGIDATGAFFTAASTTSHPQDAIVYNKNVVNGLSVEDVASCDNQSSSLAVSRTVYGVGDSFVTTSLLVYQGDILSAGGDEGAFGVASQIEHDLDCFWGTVETWDSMSGELLYEADDLIHGVKKAFNPQKLGTSRPLVNMNPAKWITAGTVQVIYPDSKSNGRIVGKGVPWDASVVGRFLAITDLNEHYLATEPNALGGGTGREVFRWWRISALDTSGADPVLYVDHTAGYADPRGGPTLFRLANYGKDLTYAIAPGAWVSDVRRAVTGDLAGRLTEARPDDPRTLVLAPSSPAGDAAAFAPGDPITNAVGPAPAQPTGFRARHFDSFPALPGYSFLSENYGRVQLGAALAVLGGPPPPDPHPKDGRYPFGAALDVVAATEVAIKIRGEVDPSGDKASAIDLYQPGGTRHRIRWFVKDGAWAAKLHASPVDGTFVFEGGPLDFGQQSSLRQQGLSATATAAKRLRGIDVAVPGHAAKLEIAFAPPEDDAKYALLLQCSWPTASTVQKKAEGFVARFSPPAPAAGGKIDWLLVR